MWFPGRVMVTFVKRSKSLFAIWVVIAGEMFAAFSPTLVRPSLRPDLLTVPAERSTWSGSTWSVDIARPRATNSCVHAVRILAWPITVCPSAGKLLTSVCRGPRHGIGEMRHYACIVGGVRYHRASKPPGTLKSDRRVSGNTFLFSRYLRKHHFAEQLLQDSAVREFVASEISRWSTHVIRPCRSAAISSLSGSQRFIVRGPRSDRSIA